MEPSTSALSMYRGVYQTVIGKKLASYLRQAGRHRIMKKGSVPLSCRQ